MGKSKRGKSGNIKSNLKPQCADAGTKNTESISSMDAAEKGLSILNPVDTI